MPVSIITRTAKGSNLWPNEADQNLINLKSAIDALEPLLQMLNVGTIISTMNSTTANGWLECNGQEVSRVTYSALYSWANTNGLIAATADGDNSNPFGDGDGSTTFKLPDLREKILRGKGAAEVMGANVAPNKLKAIDHTHTHSLELPPHIHQVNETQVGYDGAGATMITQEVPPTEPNDPGTAISGGIDSIDQDINVEQPSMNVRFLIKT